MQVLASRVSGKSSAAGSGGKPLKRRDADKLKTFGFDKVAAVLCYSNQLARYALLSFTLLFTL